MRTCIPQTIYYMEKVGRVLAPTFSTAKRQEPAMQNKRLPCKTSACHAKQAHAMQFCSVNVFFFETQSFNISCQYFDFVASNMAMTPAVW